MLEAAMDWIPFDPSDAGKTKEFMPEDVWEIQLSDDIGTRRFLVLVKGRDGMDWRQRNSQPLLPKEEFLVTTG